jgi:hypothetical protein
MAVHDKTMKSDSKDRNPRPFVDGLLDMTARTEVFEGSIMSLDDAMFVPGALIFDRLKSRAVNFGVPGEPSIRIRFPDLPHLGVWTTARTAPIGKTANGRP